MGFRLRKVIKAKPQKKIAETEAIFANIEKKHIPTDLVVAQEALAAESSLRLDFLLLHNFGASFDTP
jgi:hypothetical protein